LSEPEAVGGGHPHHQLALPLARSAWTVAEDRAHLRQQRLSERPNVKHGGEGDIAAENRV